MNFYDLHTCINTTQTEIQNISSTPEPQTRFQSVPPKVTTASTSYHLRLDWVLDFLAPMPTPKSQFSTSYHLRIQNLLLPVVTKKKQSSGHFRNTFPALPTNTHPNMPSAPTSPTLSTRSWSGR